MPKVMTNSSGFKYAEADDKFSLVFFWLGGKKGTRNGDHGVERLHPDSDDPAGVRLRMLAETF